MIKNIVVALLILVSASCAQTQKEVKIINVEEIASNVWLVSDSSAPVISINFSFDGGLLFDPSDKPGVGRLVSILLDEGAGEYNSQEFQKALSNNSISMGFTAGRDAFYGDIKTLTKNKDKAFELLNLALTQPHFNEDAITRMKNANIADIKDSLGNPKWLAARSFNGMLFKGHPYELPGYGHLKSMRTITRRDLMEFRYKQFTKEALKISIAGDISKAEALIAVRNIFSTLPMRSNLINVSNTPLQHKGKTILLEVDTPQTFISVANQGINRKDPDWHAATIMNYILGGGSFKARLMEEIRKKRGLTYGVYSSINSMKHANLIRADLSTSNEKASEALKVLKTEWQKMADKGVSAEELKDAKSYLTGSLLLGLTSTSAIASTLNSLQQNDLGYNYINKRNDKIKAVKLEDIQRVAKRLLKADELTIVMAGKPENIFVDIKLDKPPKMED